MTNLVRLRAVRDTDLPIFYQHQLDPVATRLANFPARAQAAFNAHWAKIRANENLIIQTIDCDGQVAGNIGCYEQDQRWYVGYWLGQDFWGKGIATQALAALLKQMATRPLYAYVAAHNLASRRVLEKCGFALSADEGEELLLKLDA